MLADPLPHNCYLLLSATWHSPNSSKNLWFFHINPQKQKHELQHLLLLTEWCILSPQQKIFMSSICSGLFFTKTFFSSLILFWIIKCLKAADNTYLGLPKIWDTLKLNLIIVLVNMVWKKTAQPHETKLIIFQISIEKIESLSAPVIMCTSTFR